MDPVVPLLAYDAPALDGVLVRREKRFIAHVDLKDGRRVLARCPNTGSMWGLADPGQAVRVTPVPDHSKGKLRWLWVQSKDPQTDAFVGVNTVAANAMARRLLDQGVIEPWADWRVERAEFAYRAGSRCDFLLRKAHPSHGDDSMLLEVKSVTMLRPQSEQRAEFPDARSERALKHVLHLCDQTRANGKAGILLMVQRHDATSVGIAADIHPELAQAFVAAVDAGVQVVAWSCRCTAEGVWSVGPLKFSLTA